MITASIPSRLGVGVPVITDLAWSPEDPLAVMVTFRSQLDKEDRVTWTIGRDLLAVGAVSGVPHGLGDAKVRRDKSAGTVILCLDSGLHQDILIPAAMLDAFLKRVLEVSGEASDDECVMNAIDDFIESIREEEGRA